MAGKTQWEGHSRVPRTWLLDDGSTLLEPLMERTTGGRRVRSTEDVKFTGSHHDAAHIAFTTVLRKAKARGRIVVCEAHTLDDLTRRLPSMRFPTEPPMLHLTNDYYSLHATSNGRLESDKTRFWTTWEHPTLPIHFVSINGIETSYYSADTLQELWHVPLFPGFGMDPDEQLVAAPGTAEVTSVMGVPHGSNPILARVPGHWEGVEFWDYFPVQPKARIIEGRREAMRLLLIAATRINRLDSLEIPDLWSAVKMPVDDIGRPEWTKPPLVEIH